MFNGSQCEIEPDDCVGHGCSNGGMCHDLLGDYECLCPVSGQFTGERYNSSSSKMQTNSYIVSKQSF